MRRNIRPIVRRATPVAGYVIVDGRFVPDPSKVAPIAPMSADARRKVAVAANTLALHGHGMIVALRTMVATRSNLASLYRK